MNIGYRLCTFIILFFNLTIETEGQNTIRKFVTFNEVWQDKIPVSAELRVGIVSSFDDRKNIAKSFTINLPKATNKKLCSKINSYDGKYFAKMECELKGIKPGILNIDLDTSKYKKELEKYSSKEIMIISYLAENCKENNVNYILSTWNSQYVSSDTVYILLNTENPTSISYALNTNKISQDITCKKIEKSNSIAYNCLCSVPKKLIENHATFVIKQRVRRLGSVDFNNYPLNFEQ
ncbi:MAG: hypothetical protein IPG55_06710 [Saprospiraceae bacterium]|nr:hypothetical protein [Candidatus Defluviibacterium haderslevense]